MGFSNFYNFINSSGQINTNVPIINAYYSISGYDEEENISIFYPEKIEYNNNSSNIHIRSQSSFRNYVGASCDSFIKNYYYVINESNNLDNNAFFNQYTRLFNSGFVNTNHNYYSRLDNNSQGNINTSYQFRSIIVNTGTITNNWGFHIEGEDKNYLSGKLGIGATNPVAELEVAGLIDTQGLRIRVQNNPPSSPTDIGQAGEIRISGNYIYVCKNTNSWVRFEGVTTW